MSDDIYCPIHGQRQRACHDQGLTSCFPRADQSRLAPCSMHGILGCPHCPTPRVEETVNHPPHYKAGGLEAIDVIEAFKLNFRLGNVVKYILRADLKGSSLEDLKKAEWYLKREIAKREGGTAQ